MTDGARTNVTIPIVVASGGTASSNDYTAPSSISIAQGQTTGTATFSVRNDLIDEDAETVTLQIDESNLPSGVQSGTPTSVTITIADDDDAGIQVLQSGLSHEVAENGGTDTFQVRLTSQPTSNVTVAVTSQDTSRATVNPTSLTFTSGNWGTYQRVTVTGVKDADSSDDDVDVQIRSSSTDTKYSAESADITVEVLDIDTPGVTVNPTSISFAEGATGTYTVVLNTDPGSGNTVTIGVSSRDTGAATVDSSSLTFTGGGSGTWNTAQTVTVTGVQDDDGNDESVTISHTIGGYTGVTTVRSVTASVSDDDVQGALQSVSTLRLNEGASGSYTLRLNSDPGSVSVTVTITSANTSAVTVNPTSVTFDNTDWSTPKSVSVSAVDNSSADGERTVNTTHAVTRFGAGTPTVPTVAVTVSDDDVASLRSDAASSIALQEGGNAVTYNVRLNTDPGGSVSVTITSSDPNVVTVTPSSLTFDSSNWNQDQEVTINIAAPDDDEFTDARTATISHAVSGYGTVTAGSDISVTLSDNDPAEDEDDEEGGGGTGTGTEDGLPVVSFASATGRVA